ncbi:zinc finger protein RFP-like [Python bivittatus]|uniref:Zinc finger protein RFP-like n=1 Tax=Python bivittatus TaxID=176946 RepID=A0A9F5N3B3_PYTBI|nr:zinc finger protein RFP-like [Python bivittatus]
MDVGKISEYLLEAVTCALCLNVFSEPVTLSCSHNFCSACIQKSWAGAQSNVRCPQCQQSFASVALRPNGQLESVSWLIKQLQEKGVLKKRLCEAHQQPVKLFCQDDQVLLCFECEKSQAHVGHVFASMEEAAHNFKREINVLLELLKLREGHVRASFSDVLTERQNLEKIMEHGSQRFVSEYKELYETVQKVQTEQLTLARSISEDIEQELSELVRKYNEVRALKRELAKKNEEEPAYEFLQDIKAVMARYREVMTQPPEGNFPAFKEKIWDLSLRNLFICNTLKRCKGAMPVESDVQRASVSLDPVTAYPRLLLSASRKIVTHDSTFNSLVSSPRAFDMMPCILAEEGFTSGRHCWQVEVTSGGHGWAVGVMKESVERKGPLAISVQEGIWALVPELLPPAYRKAGTSRFRLYLDYEGGTICFFEVDSRELVALRSYAVFLGERVFPFFMLGEPNTQMRVVP